MSSNEMVWTVAAIVAFYFCGRTLLRIVLTVLNPMWILGSSICRRATRRRRY